MESRFVLVTLVAALFAGCASEDAPNQATTTFSPPESTSRGPATGTQSGTTGPAPTGTDGNKVPTGSITASTPDGPAPLKVNFTLTGADADGDSLTWNIDLDGDGDTDQSGSELPTTVSQEYKDAKLYEVTYSLSDGTDTVTYSLKINVTAKGIQGPTEVFAGDWSDGSWGCVYRRTAHNPEPSELYATILVEPSWIGKPYRLEFDAATPTYFVAHIDDEEGEVLADHSTYPLSNLSAGAPGTEHSATGTVPADSYFIFLSSCPVGASAKVIIG